MEKRPNYIARSALTAVLALATLISPLEVLASGKSDNPVQKKVERTYSISQEGINLVKESEGFRDKPYLCQAGVRTIGYGHAIKKGENYKQVSREQAEKILVQDLSTAQNAVRKHVKTDLTQNQYDALCSFVFNVGEGNFKSSTLLKKLNKGDYSGAAEEFPRWNKAGGKVSKGLTNRRNKEKTLFLRN